MQRKNNAWILFFLLFMFSCNKKETVSKLAIDLWSEQVDERLTLAQSFREVAQENNLECRADFYNVKYLKDEIKVLETKLQGRKKISGTWKHLNFEKLPDTQVEFLKRFGEQLGDYNKTDYDFSACSDVPCILNTIYNKPDGIEGLAIYYWYLKMGNILSVDNKMLDQKSPKAGVYQEKEFAFDSYLWSKEELYGFWRLANSLSSSYSILPRLTEIQRAPRTARFEEYKINVCGLAYPSGTIMLNDGCLVLEKGARRDYGDFYASVIHEMSHQIDFTLGANNLGYYSIEDEWLVEGGVWTTKESVNSKTGETERKWQSSLKADQWVSKYASSSPIEHFAETLSYYRHEPDRVLKILPKTTYSLVKEKFFESKAYDIDALLLQFSTELDLFEKDIFSYSQKCLSDPQDVVLSDEELQKVSVLGASLDLKRSRCITRNTLDLVKSVISSVKINRIDGCKVYSDGNGGKINTSLEALVSKRVLSHVQNALADENYFNKLKTFYESLSNSKYSREAYVLCYKQSEEEACFKNKIINKVKSIIPENAHFSETYRADLIAKFLEANPYSKVRDETQKAYNNFLFASQDKIRDTASESFKACKSVPSNDQVPPKIKDFSPGEAYVVSSLINCLNVDVDKSLQFLVDNLNTDISIKIEQERLIVTDLVKPIYLVSLRDILTKDIAEETHMLKVYKEEQKVKWRESLVSNFSWVSSFVDVSKQKSDCLKAAEVKIDLSLLYHVKESEFGQLLNDLCSEVVKSPELKKYVDDHYLSSIDAALEELIRYLSESARTRARTCLTFYPHGFIGDFLNSKKRVQCLEDQWRLLETKAFQRFNKEGLGSRYQYNEMALAEKFKPASQRLKEKIIVEEFK
ncbi:MAG: hypothetical protein ACOYL6_06165 [Bacteriovoracaceae bacterium]